MAFKLDARRPVGAEMVRAIREELVAAARFSGDPREPLRERVHRARTAAKKARSSIKLLRSDDSIDTRRESRRIGEAAGALGGLRDAESMVSAFQDLLRPLPPARRSRFAPILAALRQDRDRILRSKADVEARLAEYLESVHVAAERIGQWRPGSDAPDMLDNHRWSYKQARAGLAGAQSRSSAVAFHEWRKAAKAYAYQCQLLRAAWPPVMKKLRGELKELGELLGDEHDLTVLAERIRGMRREQPPVAGAAVFREALQMIEARRNELRKEAIPLGMRIFADRPKAVSSRMKKWWRVAAAQK